MTPEQLLSIKDTWKSEEEKIKWYAQLASREIAKRIEEEEKIENTACQNLQTK